MTRTLVAEFELVDHGIQGEQYFQGCGLSHTDYAGIATGCGNNPAEAIDDALEQLAQSDWEVDGMESRIMAQEFPCKRRLPVRPQVRLRDEDCHYYVSIRVK